MQAVNQRSKTYFILLLSIITLLSGCATIEHRSEEIPRQPLPTIHATPFVEPTIVWRAEDSSGTGKMNAKLHPAVTPHVVIIADYKGQLFAYDRKNGAKLWQANTQASISAGPTIYRSTIFVGTREGDILAYHLNDGTCLWKMPVSGEVLASPTASQDTLFVNALDSSITALKLQDGEPMWRYCLNAPSVVLRASSSPIVKDQHVVVGFANGKLLSFHRLDGSVEWERQLGDAMGRSDVARMADISADPVIVQNTVYAVSYQGRLAALSLETGEPFWERAVSSSAGLVLSAEWLYVSERDGSVRAMARHTGETLWRQSCLRGRHLTKPVLWKGVLVIADDEGYCHFVSLDSGTIIGRMRVDTKGIDVAPTVSNDQLIVLGRSGKLVVLCR